MAVIENRFVCDLAKPVQAQALKGNVFSLDNLGSRISVLIYDNDQPATISGSVTANCILPDGSTVNVNGSMATENGGSKAYVDVPQSCLLIPGILKIAIKCTSSSVITTLAAIVANVYMTKTDNVITPSQQIITDWNAEISSQLASAVKFSSQSLTDTQKATARSNISAASASELQAEATARATADTTLQGNIDAEAATRAAADADLKSAMDTANSTMDTANSILIIDDPVSIYWKIDNDGSINTSTGASQTSSVWSYTNYIDVRAFEKITYKQHIITGSSINSGIAFYNESKTFISNSGINGIKNGDEEGVQDKTVNVPSGACYVRCTMWKDQTKGAFSISGHSKLYSIEENAKNISEPLLNLFNDNQLFGKKGITQGDIPHEYVGTAESLSVGHFLFDYPFEENTQYTISANAYDETNTSTSNGLELTIVYTDTTTSSLLWTRDTSSYSQNPKTITTTANKTINYIKMSYRSGNSEVWHIKEIMIVKGTIAKTFEPYKLTALDDIAREALSQMNDDIRELQSMTSPVVNLFNDEIYHNISGVTVVGEHEFSATAAVLSRTINITGTYKTNARYTISASAYNSRTGVTGNGLKMMVYYTDETYDQTIWRRENNAYSYKSLVSANGKTVDHFIIAYGSGSSDVWYIKNIQIEESVGRTAFTPYEITEVDKVARKKYDVIATGDESDRTNDIMSALQTNGFCRLSPGLFCTTGIAMPDGSMLVGCGNATDIRLLPTEDEATHIAVNLSRDCTVKNVKITGSAEEIVIPQTFGNRHGIGYFGTGSGSTIARCVIDGCFIRSFTGGGITAYNTGYGERGMSISDCNIYNNYCGFHDEHRSEYHCLHGCNIVRNYIGVLNNGGNNRFTSCNISTNEYGFMMDNSSGTHNNDGHGVCVGCILHHNNIPIYIHSGDSGFTFTGCSIAPDAPENDGTYIISSKRTVFSGCNFCKIQKITVDGGNLLMFVGCIFRSTFSENTFINVDGRNTSIRFDACYTDNGVPVDPTGG